MITSSSNDPQRCCVFPLQIVSHSFCLGLKFLTYIRRLVVSPKPSAKPLPFNTELYNFLHQVPSSSLLTSVGRFNMDRGNYKTLTAILAKCALQHALTNPDGTVRYHFWLSRKQNSITFVPLLFSSSQLS